MTRSTYTQRLLFPPLQYVPLDQAVNPLDIRVQGLFNAQIETNAAQLQAVHAVVHMKEIAAPFILFGP